MKSQQLQDFQSEAGDSSERPWDPRSTHVQSRGLRDLEQRIGSFHLRQRLGIEYDYEARIFGQGANFFHIENWSSFHSVIRNTLRLLALHGRGQRNARRIEVIRNVLEIDELAPGLEGFTILQISDLHLDMSEDMPDALIAAVRNLEYDICVLTGDFRAKTYGPWEHAVAALGRLRPHLDESVYAILGNHDTIRMVPGIEELGIHALLNESVLLERAGAYLYVAGIDDPHYFQAHNLEKACQRRPDQAVSLLLSHSPEVYRQAAHADFHAMLCGHTHGGQICLPGRIPIMRNARAPRRLCSGPWRYGTLKGYTSRGSGVSVVDVRFNCPPEVTLHELRRPAQA